MKTARAAQPRVCKHAAPSESEVPYSHLSIKEKVAGIVLPRNFWAPLLGVPQISEKKN